MSTATNIRRYMYAADVTQAELSRLSGVSRDAIGKYLSGAIEPNMAVLERLARALGITTDLLQRKKKCKATGRLRPEDAANMLQMDVQTIRVGIRAGVLPFGTAIKTGQRYNYNIDPQALIAYHDALAAARELCAKDRKDDT